MATSIYQGEFLDDRFELTFCLGEGGSGTVWAARDHQRGITVAVKILHRALRSDSERRAEFERESELCGRMRSPHIVRVLSHGVDSNDRPFIAYEHLEGETLHERIARDGPLSLDETETVVVHVARALFRAHSMCVVHKDIKPSNVFLTKDDQGRLLAKVLDFGIAEIDDGTARATSEICGTVEYMPREVLVEGCASSDRCDLYSLAAVAYECLTGAPPFRGEILEVVGAMEHGPPSLRAFFPAEAASALDAWVRRGIALSPSDRFTSAKELAESFHAAIVAARIGVGVLPRSRGRVPQGARIGAPRLPEISVAETLAPPPSSARDAETIRLRSEQRCPPPDADPAILDESVLRPVLGANPIATRPTIQLAKKR